MKTFPQVQPARISVHMSEKIREIGFNKKISDCMSEKNPGGQNQQLPDGQNPPVPAETGGTQAVFFRRRLEMSM